MKTTKRFIAMAAALTLTACAAMPMASFAADPPATPTTYTVTINGNTADKGTHTYGAYQIFTGDLAADGTLSNIQWGSGISATGQSTLGNAAEYAAALTDSNAATKAAELAQYLTTAEKTGSASITGLTGGYYLIQDESGSPDASTPEKQPASKTKYILKVVKDTTVDVKSSVPSVVKKVQDINDSDATPTLSGLQDSADYDIGDSIPYTITATIGDGINNFSSYSFEFHDEMSAGLSMDDDVAWKIEIGDKDVTGNFTITNTGNTYTWAVTDKDLKTYTYTEGGEEKTGTLTAGDTVVLTYNAILNKNAVVGSTGNPNEVWLKFDNNPNSSGQGNPAGETPKDKNIVFTYKTVFNKVNENNQPLVGADFKLEKKVNGVWVDVTNLGSGENKPSKTGDSTGSTFTFSGLDDGDYKLTEVTTPEGYNTISPIEFKITATHDLESDDPALKTLTATGLTMEANIPSGSLTAAIKNEKGSNLPATGGIGTTLFILGGGCAAGIAGIYLISKKKTREEE
ncbi:MAG: isopeptide-forming domain-containing fimbrial protein [Ruminococcus flavefaciens]